MSGFYLGYANGRPLITNPEDFGHVTMLGPPGSGKTRGLIAMNGLTSDDSMIFTDMKSEVHRFTAGFRQSCGHDIFVFAPGERRTHCINPFDRIEDTPDRPRLEDLQTLAETWVKAGPKEDPIWPGGARGLFTGIALFLWDFYGRERMTMGELYRFAHAPVSHAAFIKLLLWKYRERLTPECQRLLGVYANEPEKTAGSIMATLRASLKVFANPFIDYMTRRSDLDISAFRRRKQDLYLCVDDERMAKYGPLLGLLMDQILGSMSGKDPDVALEPHALTFLGDEFGNFGRLERIARGVTSFRSKRIRLCLILQMFSQLVDLYGPQVAKTIKGSSKYRLIYTPNDPDDAKEISGWLGTATVHRKHVTRHSDGSRTTSDQYDAVPLMSPNQVARMSKKDFLLFAESTAPIYGKTRLFGKWAKRMIHHERHLKARASLSPPEVPELSAPIEAPEVYKPMFDRLEAEYNAWQKAQTQKARVDGAQTKAKPNKTREKTSLRAAARRLQNDLNSTLPAPDDWLDDDAFMSDTPTTA